MCMQAQESSSQAAEHPDRMGMIIQTEARLMDTRRTTFAQGLVSAYMTCGSSSMLQIIES